jgi:late competence protein required for DNA uptake (superfamily II DNA/RNA helicase)
MDSQNEVANDVEINAEMVEKPINKIDCSFCLENLENTRISECSHIFCLSCLLQLEDKQMSGKIKCPICDTDNEIPPD